MAATLQSETTVRETSVTETSRLSEGASKSVFEKASDPVRVNITRLPTHDLEHEDPKSGLNAESRTVLHIYFEHPCQHKTITPIPSPSQERRFGPTSKQQKERRIAKKIERKLREATQTFPHLHHESWEPDRSTAPPASAELEPTKIQKQGSQHEQPNDFEPSDSLQLAFFLHRPYLSFHRPPSVLYTCPTATPSRYSPCTPVALIHAGCFWRTYRIQIGAGLARPGVVDPRGVVSWAHNGGSKEELEEDERMLKGYRVRGWRLWGESGRLYLHRIRSLRASGVKFEDPDRDGVVGGRRQKVKADEVVSLSWTRPLSRQTRAYAFTFRGVVFEWKGTGTVREDRKCGWLLRFAHLKLVAKVPVNAAEKVKENGNGTREVCLATYTSSIAAEKNGTLEVVDDKVLAFVDEWMPSLSIGTNYDGEEGYDTDVGPLRGRVERLKRGALYQVIVATVLCVASAEKEKRHTLIDLVIGIAENGGNGGG